MGEAAERKRLYAGPFAVAQWTLIFITRGMRLLVWYLCARWGCLLCVVGRYSSIANYRPHYGNQYLFLSLFFTVHWTRSRQTIVLCASQFAKCHINDTHTIDRWLYVHADIQHTSIISYSPHALSIKIASIHRLDKFICEMLNECPYIGCISC